MTSKRPRAMKFKYAIGAIGLAALVSLLAPAPDAAQNGSDKHLDHRHHAMDKQGEYVRSVHTYRVPNVALVDKKGDEIALTGELSADTPILLNFIFTTCTAVCPVLSATFSQAQAALASEPVKARMVSISIDPEHDTPERLRVYAERFRAGPGWRFFTGDLDSIIAVQKAFDAYRGDKMNHIPLTFLRAPGADDWVRLEGFTSGADLVREYRELVALRQ